MEFFWFCFSNISISSCITKNQLILILRILVNTICLWQSEGRLDEAVEQCYQATLTYPEDGEILVLYAQLVWEVHHDQAKASSYFERAALVAPNDR